MKLFDFAFCQSWRRKLEQLASIAQPEFWGESDDREPLPILQSYGLSPYNGVNSN